MLQSISEVHCKYGGERILLPDLDDPGKPRSLYWPEHVGYLVLVCRLHGHGSIYTRSDVRQEPAETGDSYLRDKVLWSSEFRCQYSGCDRTVLAHATVSRDDTAAELVELVLCSRPGLMCTAGHMLSPGAELISAKPVRFSAWQNWRAPEWSRWDGREARRRRELGISGMMASASDA